MKRPFLDPVNGTVRVGPLTPSGWASSVGLTAGTAAIDGFDGPAWVRAAFSRRTAGAGWEVSASVGLTDTAPDVSVGLSWRVRLAGE